MQLMLKPSDEMLMEALLESLSGLTMRLLYNQNLTTLDETELALEKVQNIFEDEMQAKNIFKQTKRITNNKKINLQKRNNPNAFYRTNCFTVNEKWGGKYSNNEYNEFSDRISNRHQSKYIDHQKRFPKDKKHYDKHKGVKRQLNDEYVLVCRNSNKQRDCTKNNNELHVLEKQLFNKTLNTLSQCSESTR
ncbi:hypothetical protein RFI_09889 [Reticulomyxa filosa]|uniref:Uncharacterized protein n=1 Tax=Reticulomyxa filosa TaxID=46433 RepID=X6NLS6_RETFI|nr:hypothetical protein RFI_09889 [Reticulomyxa filosa]|eukprot:ETO27240.1 hypothetical protein RFI_09889 [Reticulomyxa filosa]